MNGLGWKVDEVDARDFDAAKCMLDVGARVGAVVSGASLRRWRPYRLYQRQASSCVAFALSRAINIYHRMHAPAGSSEPPVPSQQWIYAIGRYQEHAGVDPRVTPIAPLDDNGSFPRLVMRAVKNLGFVPAERCPYSPEHINDPLDPLLVHEAVDQSGMVYARIFETGLDRVRVVRELVASGTPVIFGMTVDTAYTKHTGDAPIEGVNTADAVGGHMQAVLGVTEDGLIDIDNWWHAWGDDEGTARLDPHLFGSEVIGDVYAVQAAPLYAGE